MDGNNNLSNSRGLHKELVMASPQETITKLNNIVTNYDAVPNLENGSAANSLRAVGSTEEDSSYAIGRNAVTLGNNTKASGNSAVALGSESVATSDNAVAIGAKATASGNSSYAIGYLTTASGTNSYAEGRETQAIGNYTHTQGYKSKATASYAFAGGANTTASGTLAHADGNGSTASGHTSYAIGENTIANHRDQFVFGKFNVADTNASAATAVGDYAEIVGNGTADDARSNARTLDWNGNEVLAGTITAANIPEAPTDGGVHYLTALTLFGRTTYAWRTLSVYGGEVE